MTDLDVVAGGLSILFSRSSKFLANFFALLAELVELRLFVFLASFLSKAVNKPRSRIFSTGSQVLSLFEYPFHLMKYCVTPLQTLLDRIRSAV